MRLAMQRPGFVLKFTPLRPYSKGRPVDQDWLTTFLLIMGLCCVLPLFVAMIGTLFAANRLYKAITPDPEKMKADYEALKAEDTGLHRDALVQKIIRRQAVRSGIIGAITGLGGFITIPIALPIDIYTSLRIQSAMVNFIAYAYGHTDTSQVEEQIKSTLIMAGGSRVTRTTTRLMTTTATRFLGKTLSKLLPLIGALVSFGVNYSITRTTGYAAVKWYASREGESA